MRLTDEQRELAGRHVWLAKRIAADVARRRPGDAEEIECAAYAGLCDAALRYEPGRVKFATYAQHRIRGEIEDAARAMMPKGYRRPGELARVAAGGDVLVPLSLATPEPWRRGEARPSRLTLADSLAADDLPVGWEAESADAVAALVRGLHPEYRAALVAYLTHCATAGSGAAVGRSMGVCASRGWQMVTGALVMLREQFGADEHKGAA